MCGHCTGHFIKFCEIWNPEIFITVQVAAVGLGGVLVGGQEAQLRAVGQADGVAGQRDPEILFSNIYDVRPEVFRPDFGGRQEDLRIACHDRVFKGFKCKIPVAPIWRLLRMFLTSWPIFRRRCFWYSNRCSSAQRQNPPASARKYRFSCISVCGGFVIIAVPRICLPGVLTAGHLFFMLIALRTQFCGVSNEHVHFFQVEIGFVIPAGQ